MNELIRKNVFAFVKKEPVYFFTMTLIAAIMFAFNSMLFLPDIQELCEQSFTMDVLLLISTGIIVLVNVWLIHYIMEYMLKNRSKEFAIYMLIGTRKKDIFLLFCRETCYQSGVSWLIGLAVGWLIQQILMDIFYHLFRIEYKIKANFSFFCVIFSFVVYTVCYVGALISIRKHFMKLNIAALLKEKRKTELVDNGKISIFHKCRFNLLLLKNNRLFLYRTVTSKFKTMKKLLFITVLLLSCSLICSTIAMFYTDYQNVQIDVEFPFSLMIYHDDITMDFHKEKELLNDNHIGMSSEHEYVVYRNSSQSVRIWLYTHLNYFSDLWKENDYNINQKILNDNPDCDVYYKYNTFMQLSDYNKLREMLGLPEKKLKSDKYIFQVKYRISDELTSGLFKKDIVVGNKKLQLSEICTDDFEQNGHNGADYIIVVPDDVIGSLKPYYTVYAMQTKESIPINVAEQLRDINTETDNFKYGSNHNILYTSPVLMKTEIENSLKSAILAIMFPFAYISLVFLCATMAVLSIRLLSDSKDYRYRYMILAKLGMKQSDITYLIHQQLALNYLFPAVVAFGIGGIISLHINRIMIHGVGMYVWDIKYLILSLLWISVIYLVYYILTDILFRRNIFMNM
ncbi:ABC transporter permease [Eubacterium sp. MSJ-13]|uniref:FtsX-like permease family protein n=1 Tax=Eubacterium sp. MSJ-13 TaxID=2841513 RepID=UPI001C1116E1|nr:ABC transporter permease [Eubacterium sp. MSJ-13]MBU5477656.1 ABC transporter permease [Eubacterium sp. MSJ-13]